MFFIFALQTFPFKVLVVFLLVATSSRAKLYRNTKEWNDVEDYRSADPGEEETMQDMDNPLPEFNQHKDTDVSYDFFNDLPAICRRRSCTKPPYFVSSTEKYYMCQMNCCCPPQERVEVPVPMCKSRCSKKSCQKQVL